MAKHIVCGLILRPNGLEWTLRDADRPDGGPVQRKSLPRPDGASAAPRPPAECFQEEAPVLRNATLHFALPASQTLLRVLDLPATQRDEISGMIGLQLDDICPFPPEHTLSSWEVLSATETSSRVLVCATRRSTVAPLGEVAVGMDLQRVDVDLLGWLAVLRKAGRLPPAGRHLLLFFEDGAASLVLLENGAPLLLRSLGACASAEDMRELAGDVGYALASAEAEWGALPVRSTTVWHTGDRPPELHLLETVCGPQPAVENLSSLDPLTDGLALRACAPEGTVINLAPPEWKSSRVSRENRRRILIAGGAVLTVWVLLLAVFFSLLGLRKSRYAELQGRLKALEGPVREVREMSDRAGTLAAYTNSTRSLMEVGLMIAESLPDGVFVSELSYTKSAGFSIQGNGDPGLILKFTEAFSASPLFKVKDINVEGSRFRLNAFWPDAQEGSP